MSKSIKLKELGMVSGKAYFIKVAVKETADGEWSDATPLLKFATKPTFTNPSRSAITAPLGGTWLQSDSVELTVSYQSLDGLSAQSTLYQVSTSSSFETILKEGEETGNPFTISGLPGNRLLYFRVKSKDSVGNTSLEWSNVVSLYGEERIPKIGVLTINGQPASSVTAIRQHGTLELTCEPFRSKDPTATLNKYRWTFFLGYPSQQQQGGYTFSSSRAQETSEPSVSFTPSEMMGPTGDIPVGWKVRIRVAVSDNYGGWSWWKEPLDLVVTDGEMSEPTITATSVNTYPYVLEGSPYTYLVSPLKHSKWRIEDSSTYRVVEETIVPKSTTFRSTKGIGRRLRATVEYVAEDGTNSRVSEELPFIVNYNFTEVRPAPTWIYPVDGTTINNTYSYIQLDAQENEIGFLELEVTDTETQEKRTASFDYRGNYGSVLGVQTSDFINRIQKNGKRLQLRARYTTSYGDTDSQWSEAINITIAEKHASTPPEKEIIPSISLRNANNSLYNGVIELPEYSSNALVPWRATIVEMAYDGAFNSIFFKKVYDKKNGDEYSSTLSGVELPESIQPEEQIYVRARYVSENPSKDNWNEGYNGAVKAFYTKSAKYNDVYLNNAKVNDYSVVDLTKLGTVTLKFRTIPFEDKQTTVTWSLKTYASEGNVLTNQPTARVKKVDSSTGIGEFSFVIGSDDQGFTHMVEVQYTTSGTGARNQVTKTAKVYLRYRGSFADNFVQSTRYAHLYVLKPSLLPELPMRDGVYWCSHKHIPLKIEQLLPIRTESNLYEYFDTHANYYDVEITTPEDTSFQQAVRYNYNPNDSIIAPDVFFFKGKEVPEVLVRVHVNLHNFDSKLYTRPIRVKNANYVEDRPTLQASSLRVDPYANNGRLAFTTSGTHTNIPGPVLKSVQFRGHSILTNKEYNFEEDSFSLLSDNMSHRAELIFTSDDTVAVRARMYYENGEHSDWSEPVVVTVQNSRPNRAQAQQPPRFISPENETRFNTETIRFEISSPENLWANTPPSKSYWTIEEQPANGPRKVYHIEKTEDLSVLEYRPKTRQSIIRVRAAYSLSDMAIKTQSTEKLTVYSQNTDSITDSYQVSAQWGHGRGLGYLGSEVLPPNRPPSDPYEVFDPIRMDIFSYKDTASIYLENLSIGANGRFICQTSSDRNFSYIENEYHISSAPSVTEKETYNTIHLLPYRRQHKKENFYVRLKYIEPSGRSTNWWAPVKYVYFDPQTLYPVIYSPEPDVIVSSSTDDYRSTRLNKVSYIPVTKYLPAQSGRNIETGYHSLSASFSSIDIRTETLRENNNTATVAREDISNEYALFYGRVMSGGSTPGYRYHPVRLKQSRVQNGHPETPAIVSPSPNSQHQNYIRLVATPFVSQREGRTHASTKWVISDPTKQHAVVKEITTTQHLTSIVLAGENTLPTGANKTYSVRVEYIDSAGVRSIQSAPLWFTYTGTA